jgi:ubiquinone/menaquinone biosynthesis C-methylase UbiE
MSYIAFDANAIPFKDNSIDYMTTFVGLQNIGNPNQVFNELKRASDEIFYAICVFCPENDFTNRTFLENYVIDKLWIKNRFIGEFEKVDWKTDCKNSIVAEVKPTPTGEIVKGYGRDGFPIADSNFEYCTMILYK